jgi:hypothetical protein
VYADSHAYTISNSSANPNPGADPNARPDADSNTWSPYADAGPGNTNTHVNSYSGWPQL